MRYTQAEIDQYRQQESVTGRETLNYIGCMRQRLIDAGINIKRASIICPIKNAQTGELTGFYETDYQELLHRKKGI